jgi:GNAT superfamily N-acetyltransferase
MMAPTKYNEYMKLEITNATKADIPDLVEILSQAVQYKVEHGDMSWGTRAYNEDEVAMSIASGEAYVARLNGEAVGTVKLQWSDDIDWDNHRSSGGYIHQLAIKEDFHGQGLGRQLIDWAAAEAAKNGKKFLGLDCSDQNEKLCKYYEDQGFNLAGYKSIPAYDNHTAALFERKI